jgi:16S rRNA (uracil1498-N3)-methyltransferase
MLRLFVPTAARAGAAITVAGAELRHLHALRLGPGDRLVVFDEHGCEHDVVLERLGPRAAEVTIVASRRPTRESPLDLVLAPALLKGSKMDLVVEKATELGVRRIAPVLSRHTIGRGEHVARWQRLALAAAKQSGRTTVPTVDAPVPFAALLASPWPGLRLFAWEEEGTRGFDALPTGADAAVIVVGPEGGFAAPEVAAARAASFTTVRLAGRVLRAETAAIAAVVLCQHRWGDG